MRKDYDAIEYLVKKYVDDGEHATIPLWLENKEEFFNPYDPTDTSINPDISSYLDKCSYNIPAQYKIRLDIVCNDLDDESKSKMKEAIINHFGVKVFDNNIDLKALNRKNATLTVMGLVFLFIVYLGEVLIPTVNKFADTTWGIIREVMLVTGWVFIWYVVENIIFDRKKLLEKRRDNLQMLNAIFLFENEQEYYKILKEEQKEDVEEKEEYEEIRDSFLDQ